MNKLDRERRMYNEYGDVTGIGPTSIFSVIDKVNEIIDEINTKPVLDIRYHKELFPDIMPVKKNGNFYDIYTAEEVRINRGESTLINLGISVKIPDGYWMQIVPRSSTFKNYGIIQTNSFGVIDTEYCGDNDILMMPVFAIRAAIIPAGTRLCQFRLVKDIEFDINEVEKLDGPDRGGFGSTGVN